MKYYSIYSTKYNHKFISFCFFFVYNASIFWACPKIIFFMEEKEISLTNDSAKEDADSSFISAAAESTLACINAYTVSCVEAQVKQEQSLLSLFYVYIKLF